MNVIDKRGQDREKPRWRGLRTLSPLRPDAVPYYREMMGNLDWIPDFLEIERLQLEIKGLRSERAGLKKASLVMEDVLPRLREQFDAYQGRRVTILRKAIESNRNSGNPFESIAKNQIAPFAREKLPPYITWDEVLKAIESLSEGSITAKKQAKELENLERRLAELKIRIDELSPIEFFPVKNGAVIGDVRKLFTEHWRRLQETVNGPISPRGFPLGRPDSVSELEREAWKLLNLQDFLNPATAEYLPVPEYWN